MGLEESEEVQRVALARRVEVGGLWLRQVAGQFFDAVAFAERPQSKPQHRPGVHAVGQRGGERCRSLTVTA